MASLGDISVDITLDISELKRNLQKVEKELQQVQNEFRDTAKETEKQTGKMGKAIGGLVASFGGTQLLTGLGGVVGEILNTTGEVQAQGEQYEQVMGKMSKDADKYIGEMSKTWNKHPSELKNAMMQYNAILKGKGVSEEEAYEMSKTMLERTVDANAFANEDMASTTDRFMAMVKGEYDSLDTAMVNLSATMLDDKSQEKYGKKFEDLSVEQQEQLKIQEAIRQHTSAGVFGQGEREADSYANNVANLKGTFDELKAALGSPIIATAGEILAGIADKLKSAADWFSDLPEPMQEFSIVVGIMTVAATGLALALGGIVIALGLVASGLGVSIGLVAGVVAGAVAAIAVVVGIVYLVVKYWDEIKAWTIKIFKAIWEFLKETWDNIVLVFKVVLAFIWGYIVKIWNKISSTTSKVFGSIWSKIVEIWDNIFGTIKEVSGTIWSTVKEKFSAAKKAITEPIEEAKKIIKRALDKIKGFFDNLKLKIPKPSLPKISVSKGTKSFLGQEIPYPKFNISWNKKGNIFNGASLLGGGQGVGEMGAEAVLPIEHKRYMKPFSSSIAEHLKDMQGSETKGSVTNNFDIAQLVVREEADIKRIAEELERTQRKQQRAKGNLTFA
jgi:hypothetical protein